MARSRYIKPEFFKDEDLARVSHAARLLFVGLWSLADRVGRLEDRPLRIKAEIFPYESIDVEPLLAELATMKAYGNGAFIQRYGVGGRAYIQIANFTRHQKCHPKEPDSGLPEPAAAKPGKPRQETANPPESVTESVTESESVRESESAPHLPDPRPEHERVRGSNFREASDLEVKILRAVQQISERTSRPAWEVCRQVTAYKRKDGTMSAGVEDPSRLGSILARQKALEDATWWLEDLEKGATDGKAG